MKYNLTTPCADCPFLEKFAHGFTPERLAQFASGPFPCHKTAVLDDDQEDSEPGEFVAGPNSSHCAGALIFQIKSGQMNQVTRIAERLGMFRADALDMSAPIQEPKDDWGDEDDEDDEIDWGDEEEPG